MEQTPEYLTILIKEFRKRQALNPRYSLRAFARHLEIDPSGLSRIIRGRKPLSIKVARQIIDRLKLPTPLAEVFLKEVVRSIQHRIQQSASVSLVTSADTLTEVQLSPEQLNRLMNFLNSMREENGVGRIGTEAKSVKLVTQS